MPRKPKFALNWQRKPRVADKLGTYRFSGASVSQDLSTLTLADGSTIAAGDCLYIVTNPGRPFSLGKVLGFTAEADDGPFESRYLCRINWFYRPSTANKKSKNSREVYLTMHTDLVSLNLLRGKLRVHSREQSDIDNLPPNTFWFDRFFDPNIFKLYEALPCSQVTNIPPSLGPYLRARYSHLIVEPIYARYLVETPVFCEACDMWCSLEDSVRCYMCDCSYHFCCTSPPVLSQPKMRWSCSDCTQRAAARQQLERNPDLTMRRKRSPPSVEKQREREEKEARKVQQASEEAERMEKVNSDFVKSFVPQYKLYDQAVAEHPSPTFSTLWPFRHVGADTAIQDIFDTHGRTQPHASSRVGPKNQVAVHPWPGRPVEYYRKIYAERKKRSKARPAVLGYEPDLDRSLPWVREAPNGYIERGSDATAHLIWSGGDADSFLKKCASYAETLGVSPTSSNFIDACLYELMTCEDESLALQRVGMLNKKSLKEPELTADEVELFEQSVRENGNNLHAAYTHVKTKSSADIVRFYYLWKKTDSGRKIWDNCAARVSKRKTSTSHDDFSVRIAGGADPELNYSLDAINDVFEGTSCHFCHTETSKEWRKAPGVVVEEGQTRLEALCSRCSRLWYRYGVQWQPPQVVLDAKQADPELVEDAKGILAEREKAEKKPKTVRAKKSKAPPKEAKQVQRRQSSRVKRARLESDAEGSELSEPSEPSELSEPSEPGSEYGQIDEYDGDHGETKTEDTKAENSPPSAHIEHNEPSLPSSPRLDSLPSSPQSKPPANYCMVCCQFDPQLPQLTCNTCALSVHPSCYGFVDRVTSQEWFCDCCLNDRDHQAKHLYECELCPVKLPNYVAWLAGHETDAPDALKRTWDSRWAHIRCALWSPGVMFEHPELLQQVEVHKTKQTECTLCNTLGRCVGCLKCSAKFHPGCAGAKGYYMGFQFTKGPGQARFRGETGELTPQIMCPEHDDGSLLSMCELDNEQGKSLLQIYAANYKAAGHPHISGSRRRVMLQPGTILKAEIVIPVEWTEGQREADPRTFLEWDFIACADCKTQNALYWVKTDVAIKCCGCYWDSKDASINGGHEDIVKHIGRIFNEALGSQVEIKAEPAARPAPSPSPAASPKPTPSMKIKDILS